MKCLRSEIENRFVKTINDLIMGMFSRKTYSDKKGYRRFKDSNTPVHRWAAEKKLGRKLREGEVVHHKDRNKRNNGASNLHVFKNQSEHDRAHRRDARKYGNAFSYKGKKSK